MKAVAQAISTYTMSIFLLPKPLLYKINAIMQRLWRGHQEQDSTIHWIKWDSMGTSKAHGGLGFRTRKVLIKHF
jgi:hypothetical protein